VVKLIIVFSYRTDVPAAECQEHFRTQHAALIRKYADVLRIRRYVQSPRLGSDLIEAMAAGRGWSTAADAASELWWDGHDEMAAAFSSPEGQAAGAALAEDEAAFCDPATVVALLTEEHAIVDHIAQT
jgi:uncharacterized protein (TIGR02118 family)